MKKLSLILLLGIVLIINIGCGEDKKEPETNKTETHTDPLSMKLTDKEFSEEITGKIDSVLNKAMLDDSIPGIMGGIWIQDMGSKIFKKGMANLEAKTERHIKDHYRIGSITKTFLATVFLQLCDEGKISLNDKLDKYYPEVPNAKEITMRQLLDMTSGLQDYLNVPELDSAFFYDRLKKYTDEEILELAIKLPPMFPPGKEGEYHYSNTNYLLLGMIINKVTKSTWQMEITNRVINRINLSQTLVPSTVEMPEPYCHGYMNNSGKVEDVTEIDPSITGAAGCMVSTLEDLRTYVQALVNGSMLSDTMQAERMKFVPTNNLDFMGYGLGILKIGDFYGHNGGITGFNTSMYYSPKLKAIFILNVNMFGPTGGVSDKIFASLSEVIYPGEMPWEKKTPN